MGPAVDYTPAGCIGVVAIAAIVIGAIVAAKSLVPRAFAFAENKLANPTPLGIALVAAIIFIIAIGLFALKRRYRLAYGVLELIVAVVVSATTAAGVWTQVPSIAFVQLAGCCYLAVRGIENVAEGRYALSNRVNRPH